MRCLMMVWPCNEGEDRAWEDLWHHFMRRNLGTLTGSFPDFFSVPSVHCGVLGVNWTDGV